MKSSKKALIFSIDNPCHENWENMTPHELGKFCASCQKNVIDFSQMTDYELTLFFKNNPQKQVCGRFKKDQISRSIPIVEPETNRNLWRAGLALLPGLLATPALMSQNNIPKAAVTVFNESKPSLKTSEEKQLVSINGRVMDDEGEPLMGVNILIIGMNKGSVTDYRGKFSLELPKDLEKVRLQYSYLGFEDRIEKYNLESIEKDNEQTIVLKPAAHTFEEVVVVRSRLGCCHEYMAGAITAIVKEIPQKIKPEIPEKPIDLKIYPNPFVQEFTLEFSSKEEGHYQFQLWGPNGQMILKRAYELAMGHQKIQLESIPSHIPGGIYFLKLIPPTGEAFHQQILKADY